MKLTLSSIQWAIFILAGSIVTPLAVGAAFDMSQVEISGLLQRSFFIIGACCLLQALFGHKLPILEGPAGLWWGVFLIFSTLPQAAGNKGVILSSIELGLIVSGLLFILLSMFGLIDRIRQLFTPAVTGTYLILLVIQLSGTLVKGMLGVGYTGSTIHGGVAALSVLTLVIAIVLGRSSHSLLRSYSVLIALIAGWLLFVISGLTKSMRELPSEWFSIPEAFAWGIPTFDSGILVTSIFTSIFLLTNLIASVDIVGKTVNRPDSSSYNRSGFVMGINHILSGAFSTIACVPNSHSAGFIATTKITERLPFIIGSFFIILMGFFPIMPAFFSTIPTPVAYATVFLPFCNILVVGLTSYAASLHDEKQMISIGFSLMIGIGSMFIPPQALKEVPNILAPLVNNGLILGVLTCILVEQLFMKKKDSNGSNES